MTMSDTSEQNGNDAEQAFRERLRAAYEVLEEIVANRELLVGIPAEERARLSEAAGRVSRPDAIARRRVVKASKKQRRVEKVAVEESVLAETAIRKLRRKAVFAAPNIFPPANFEQGDV